MSERTDVETAPADVIAASPAEETTSRPGTLGPLTVAGLAVLHAAAFHLAFPAAGLWPLALVAVIPLILIARHARSARTAGLIVLAVHMGLWLVINRWVIPVTAMGYPVLSLYKALYGPGFVLLLRRLERGPRTSRLPLVLTVPILWTGLEALRGIVIGHGYPWMLLGHPLRGWLPLVQHVDLLGSYAASTLAALVAAALVDAVDPARRRPVAAAVAAGVVLGAAGYGLWRIDQTGALATDGPPIASIQTNLPQDNKIRWTEAQKEEDLARFVRLTMDALLERPDARLVVWPETMVPGIGFDPQVQRTAATFPSAIDLHLKWPVRIQRFVRELGVPMVVGTETWDPVEVVEDGDRVYLEVLGRWNSAAVLAPDGAGDRADKHVLTPFGETMPYISAWPWLESRLLRLAARGMKFDLDAAPEPGRLELPLEAPGGGPLVAAAPICFEDMVGHVSRRALYDGDGRKVGHLILNLSNDGWFGASRSDRARHAMAASFRCIENRVPMIRCVNTGHSLAIDSTGRVLETIGEGPWGSVAVDGWFVHAPTLDPRTTLYARIGETWPLTCLGLAVLGAIAAGRADRRTTVADAA